MPATYRRILYFFLLAYAFTWFGYLGNWLLPSPYWPQMNPAGPLLAAPLVIWLTAGGAGVKAWLRRIVSFRAPPAVYAISVALPLAAMLLAIFGAQQAGVTLQALPALEIADVIILIPLMLAMGPFPEEVSFRGFGQHELQQAMSPLAAAILIGIGVAIWHGPLFLSGSAPLPYLLVLPAVSVVYAWLYRIGGSIGPVVMLHFVANYFGGEYFLTMVSRPESKFVFSIFYAAIYVLIAAWIALRNGTGLSRVADRAPTLRLA